MSEEDEILYDAGRKISQWRVAGCAPLLAKIMCGKPRGLPFNKADREFVERVASCASMVKTSAALQETMVAVSTRSDQPTRGDWLLRSVVMSHANNPFLWLLAKLDPVSVTKGR